MHLAQEKYMSCVHTAIFKMDNQQGPTLGDGEGQRGLVCCSPWGHKDPCTPGSGFSGGSYGKESSCNVGDLGLTPESGRSPRERNAYPLQYSCLEISVDRGLGGLPSMGHK